jgi:hypothetical protein
MKRAVPVVLAALLVLPASASAATQWFYNRQPIPTGQTVEVAGSGPEVMLSFKPPKQTAIKIPCPASGRQAFWNSPTDGFDETRTISFSCPKGTILTPLLPWTSTLVESELPLHDRWEHVALDVTFNGVNYGTFTGSLDTTVGDIDPEGEIETVARDEPDSYVTFRGGLNQSLVGPNGYRVWFSRGYRFGGKGSRVTDESGSWAQTVSLRGWPHDPYVSLGGAERRYSSPSSIDSDSE